MTNRERDSPFEPKTELVSSLPFRAGGSGSTNFVMGSFAPWKRSQDASDAAEMLNEIVGPGDLILIKGSRSSRTELVLDEFVKLQPVGGNLR